MKQTDVILTILHELCDIYPHRRSIVGLDEFSEKEIAHAKRLFRALQDIGVIAPDYARAEDGFFEGWDYSP